MREISRLFVVDFYAPGAHYRLFRTRSCEREHRVYEQAGRQVIEVLTACGFKMITLIS